MKAIQFSQTGGLEVLKYVDVPDPKPKPGQALINIKAIGVNFGEVAARKGLNPVALPAIPGGEAAGIVSETGEDVHEVAVGDLVTYFARGSESYAEKTVVPSWRLVKLPPDIDFEIGVACTVHGMTAYFPQSFLLFLEAGRYGLSSCGCRRHRLFTDPNGQVIRCQGDRNGLVKG